MGSLLRRYSRKAPTVGLLFVALVVASFAAPVAAHEHPNHGTIKVHDDESVEPPQRNQPHVTCDFWIEGFDMAESAGTLVIYEWEPTGDKGDILVEERWEADSGSDEEGWHFNEGPFRLAPGHYRVEAFLEDSHPGNDGHFAKAKMFWVNECFREPPETPPCPPSVMATAEADGDIRLDWGAVANASEYRVYRAVGDDDLEAHMSVAGNVTTFTDTDTEVGVTYRYMVTALVDGVESEDCEIVEATAIPFFPGATGLLLASLGAVGIYFVARRRG